MIAYRDELGKILCPCGDPVLDYAKRCEKHAHINFDEIQRFGISYPNIPACLYRFCDNEMYVGFRYSKSKDMSTLKNLSISTSTASCFCQKHFEFTKEANGIEFIDKSLEFIHNYILENGKDVEGLDIPRNVIYRLDYEPMEDYK